jgi:acyl carrier protein
VEVEERVRKLIVEKLDWSGSPNDLTLDYNLITNHVIDSLDMLKFISLLEQEFQIKIDDTELLPDNFATIGNVAAFVEGKRGVSDESASAAGA